MSNEYDPTEDARRVLQVESNAMTDSEVKDQGQTWTTDELQRDFDVQGFAAPFVVVVRKSDGLRGSLQFRHHPRVYFNFEPDTR
jgi:hypothetical protein